MGPILSARQQQSFQVSILDIRAPLSAGLFMTSSLRIQVELFPLLKLEKSLSRVTRETDNEYLKFGGIDSY